MTYDVPGIVDAYPVTPNGLGKLTGARTGALLSDRGLWDVLVRRDGSYDREEDRQQVNIDAANMVGSAVVDRLDGKVKVWHRPALDIDSVLTPATIGCVIDAFKIDDTWHRDEPIGWWVASATAGHGHLYLDGAVPEMLYMTGLMALATAEVIEPGYALVSIRRRQSFLRLPWRPKE